MAEPSTSQSRAQKGSLPAPETASSGASRTSATAVVQAGQSVDEFLRAFWANQVRLVENEDMESLLLRIGVVEDETPVVPGKRRRRRQLIVAQQEGHDPDSPPAVQSSELASDAHGQQMTAGADTAASTSTTTTVRTEPFPIPLARIKKVVKSNEDVLMISSETPMLLARACEILIADLSSRAYLIADSHKRRTLQRSDVVDALSQSDAFDFAIDVLPRTSHDEHAPAS